MDARRRRYVPLGVEWPHGGLATALLERFGLEGIAVSPAVLAAAKRAPYQGTFTYVDETTGWAELGMLEYRPNFSLDEFFQFTGQRKQTCKRRRGRISDVKITKWEDWNEVIDKELARERISRKRAQSTRDNERTPSELPPDEDGTEVDFEVEVEVKDLKPLADKPPRERKPDLLWDELDRICGPVSNSNERGRRNKAISLIRESEPDRTDAERVVLLQQRVLLYWKDADLTEMGIANNWSTLGRVLDEAADDGRVVTRVVPVTD